MQLLAGEVCRFQLWCGLGVSSVTLFPAARYTMEYAAKPEEGDAWVIEQCLRLSPETSPTVRAETS